MRIISKRDAGKIVFNCIVLDPESMSILESKYPGIHDKYYGHHITLNFGKQIIPENLGDTIIFQVVGYGKDEKGEAVVVSGVETDNAIPHITISTTPDTKPVYSSQLLAKGYEKIEPFTLSGRVSSFCEGRYVVDKDYLKND